MNVSSGVMNLITNRILLLLSVIIVLSGCQYFGFSSREEIVVASVGEKTMTLSDLGSQISKDHTKTDSSAIAQDLIQRWIKKELLLQMAEENLDDDQKELSREIDEFRTSLLIHRYQQQMLGNKLDTTLTDLDIRHFYDIHPENFILEINIVKAIFIEIPKKGTNPDQIKRWLYDNSTRSISELENYCFQNATKYDHFNYEWVDFNRILARTPFIYDNPTNLLQSSKLHLFSDIDNFYFIQISDYILAGEKAPFEFVKDRIESLILNSRKMEFLHQLEKNIFEKGKRENRFTIVDFNK